MLAKPLGACRAWYEGGRTLHDVLGDTTARRCDVPHLQMPGRGCAEGAEGRAKDDDELTGSPLNWLVYAAWIHMTLTASSALRVVPHSPDLLFGFPLSRE